MSTQQNPRARSAISRALVLAVAVAAGLCAAAFPMRQAPIYQSTASVLVAPAGGDYWVQHEYLRAQARLLTSREVAIRALDRLGLEHSAASTLQAKVDARLVEGTRIIAVSLADTDPDRAQRVLQALLEAFVAENAAETARAALGEESMELTLILTEARVQREKIAARLSELERDGLSARDTSELDLEIGRFERLQQDGERLYSQLLERSKLAGLAGLAGAGGIRVLDAPLPGVRIRPGPVTAIAVGLLVALVVGLVVALVRFLLSLARPGLTMAGQS